MPSTFTDDDLAAMLAASPDIAKAFGVGGLQGASNVLGVRGDIADASLRAGEWLGRSVGLPDAWIEGVRPYAQGAAQIVAGPSSQQLQQQMERVLGPLYQPQTPYGEFAQRAGRMAAEAAVGGPWLKAVGAAADRNLSEIRALMKAR